MGYNSQSIPASQSATDLSSVALENMTPASVESRFGSSSLPHPISDDSINHSRPNSKSGSSVKTTGLSREKAGQALLH